MHRLLLSGLLIIIPLFSKSQKLTQRDLEEIIQLVYGERLQEAVTRVDSLNKIVPLNDKLYPNLLMVSLEVNTRAGYYRRVVQNIEELIKLNPDSEKELLLNLGLFKSYIGDHEGAITALRKLTLNDTTDQHAYNNLAGAYNRAGAHRQAITALDHLALGPDSITLSYIYYQYAEAYQELGILDSATIHIQKYLSTNEGRHDYQAFHILAKIAHSKSLRSEACANSTKAAELLNQAGIEEHMAKLSNEQQNYYISKKIYSIIADIKRVQALNCN